MIKRFHQLNEAVKDLKDEKFFIDYFSDLLDDHEYVLKIRNVNYTKFEEKHDEETNEYSSESTRSKFPKEGFFPTYNIDINPVSMSYQNITSIKDLKKFTNICNSFTIGMESLLATSEINPKLSDDINISQNLTFPRFYFEVCDVYDIPKEELPSELFEEFYEAVENIIYDFNMALNGIAILMFRIVKNEDANKLEIIANCRGGEFDAFLRKIQEELDYAKKPKRYRDVIIFEVNVIQRKANDYHVDLLNPQKILSNNND